MSYQENINDINSQLIVTADDLKAYSLLDYNIDEEKIIPYILEAQTLFLEPMIGTPFYRKLQQSDRGYTYDYLVTNYVTSTLVSWALGIYIKRAKYQIAEGGVFSHFSTDSETVAVSEVRVMAKEYQHNAETYARKMVSFIETYKESYPEWDEDAREGYKARQTVAHLGGWVLDSRCGESWCHGLTKDPNFFVVNFWWGTNTTDTIGFDPDTLQNKEMTLPNQTQVQPTNKYIWYVSEKDFNLYQGDALIPIGDYNNPEIDGEAFVKIFDGSLYWVRSTLQDTYEDLTVINIK